MTKNNLYPTNVATRQLDMHTNKGMTFIGMLLTMAMVCMAGLIVIKVVPIYLKYYEVVNSLSSLAQIPASELSADAALNVTVLKTKLFNELYINSIQDIKEDQIIIQPNPDGVYKISVTYQVITPLLYNVSLLFNFSARQEVKIGGD